VKKGTLEKARKLALNNSLSMEIHERDGKIQEKQTYGKDTGK